MGFDKRGTVAVVASAAVVAAGCGSGSRSGSDDSAIKKSTAAAKVSGDIGLGKPSPAQCQSGKSYRLGYDSFSDTQDYAKSVQKSLNEVAKQVGCVQVVSLTDNADPATAVANVKTLVQRKVDGVVLFQIVASAQPGIMRMLNQAHIPAVAHAVPAPGATFVSPSDLQAGKAGGQALAAAAKKKDPQAKPWLVLGTDPATGAVSKDRVGGVQQAVQQAIPGIPAGHVVNIDSQSKPDVAFNRTLDSLAKIPKGQMILISGINDDVVGGMFRAIKQQGRASDTLAMGMGGLYPSGVRNVCTTPQFVGTVDFLPETMGRYIVPAMLARLAGKKVPDSVSTPVKVLDKAAAQAKYPTFTPCAGS